MKITFNPPVRPFVDGDVEISFYSKIICPECGSDRVYAHTFVTGMADVNVNTSELWEQPDDADCSIQDARSEAKRECKDCEHEWEVETMTR